MTRSLAVEWARHKIRCNAIAPGPFPTEGAWSRLVPPGLEDDARPAATKKIPAGRYGEHDELANLAAYLVADESGYITGECVTIDGGESLMGGEFNGFTTFDQTRARPDARRHAPAQEALTEEVSTVAKCHDRARSMASLATGVVFPVSVKGDYARARIDSARARTAAADRYAASIILRSSR